jgi:hypothetical protein
MSSPVPRVPSYHSVLATSEFLKQFYRFSTFLCGFTFLAFVIYIPLSSGSTSRLESFHLMLFLTTVVLLSSSLWNGITARILWWMGTQGKLKFKISESNDASRATEFDTFDRWMFRVAFIVGLGLLLAGVALFLAALYYAAGIQQMDLHLNSVHLHSSWHYRNSLGWLGRMVWSLPRANIWKLDN